MTEEKQYDGPEKRKHPCDLCGEHKIFMKDFRELAKTVKGTVSMDMFKWMFRGIGGVLIIILLMIVTLHVRFGNLQTDLLTGLLKQEKRIDISLIKQELKVGILQENQSNIIKMQTNFTEFVARHNIKPLGHEVYFNRKKEDGG